MFPRIVLSLLVFLVLPLQAEAPVTPTIIISFDGFRWDYIDRFETPNIDRVIREGFRVKRVKPSFPSLTFPNHVSLLTGLHPHRHGIVGNHMYDPALQREFHSSAATGTDDPQWYRAPMLWEIAREAGMKTAAFFWVGSEMQGRHPDRFFKFTYKIPISKRLDQLERWLDPADHPSPGLMLLYFFESDTAGHDHGPSSQEVKACVAELDAAVGRITGMLEKHKREAHLLFVSDHGMTPMLGKGLSLKKIKDAVPADHFDRLIHNWSIVDLFVKNPTAERIDKVLASLPASPHIKWYRREAVPHPTHPVRNGHIMGLLATGTQVLEQEWSDVKGGHGFDIDHPDMGATCFGKSPSIKPGSVLEKTEVVDFFPLVLHLMKLPQREVDGRLAIWSPILLDPGGRESKPVNLKKGGRDADNSGLGANGQ